MSIGDKHQSPNQNVSSMETHQKAPVPPPKPSVCIPLLFGSLHDHIFTFFPSSFRIYIPLTAKDHLLHGGLMLEVTRHRMDIPRLFHLGNSSMLSGNISSCFGYSNRWMSVGRTPTNRPTLGSWTCLCMVKSCPECQLHTV